MLLNEIYWKNKFVYIINTPLGSRRVLIMYTDLFFVRDVFSARGIIVRKLKPRSRVV